MQKIKQLSPHEAQKIAAGEVVERPANAIKELIENALDAGATSIALSITNAGIDCIKITDNGCGMSQEDAHMCFKQFATSKISHVDELHSVNTFGFRGEALTSIAAVSHVTLITKEESSAQAIELQLDQGTITDEKCTSSNAGTTFIVRGLFFNVPARKKFLKTRDTEWRQIQHIFYAFCFDYLNVHFKLEHDERLIFNCPAATNLKDRFAQLFDHTQAQNMMPLCPQQKDSISVTGIISNHHYVRYDRSHIFLFVNRRWVKNHGLAKALIKGYSNSIPADRYPSGCIFIEIDPSQIDVNIHPRKEEIQFLHPRIVETLIQNAVKETLEQALSAKLSSVRPLDLVQPHLPAAPIMHDALLRPVHAYAPTFTMPPMLDAQPINYALPEPFVEKNTMLEFSDAPASAIASTVDLQEFTLIGQFHKTYLLIEQSDGLFLIDQHAAHERILYEQFSQRFDDVATIKLLFPTIMHVTRQEIDSLEPHLHLFKDNGIILDVFGNNQIIIQATPVHAKNLDIIECIRSVIGWIDEYNHLDHEKFSKTIHEKLHAQMACKAAVKAGDILTMEHMQQLLKDLARTPNRFSCPHGRPTGWLVSLHEIEKKFRRKL